MCALKKKIDPQIVSSSKQENWWDEPVVQYAFNFPSVTVNLERLIGTHVVQMTDPTFMLDLRDRVWKDYDTKLSMRIMNRKTIEKEREAKFILKGVYNNYNRPRKFIPFHSSVLALDLGSRKNVKIKSSTEENADNVSPIFKINERTNDTINQRRLKLNSIRQKNVDRIIRQTRLEGLQPNIEYDGLTAVETKIKEIERKRLDSKPKIRKKILKSAKIVQKKIN